MPATDAATWLIVFWLLAVGGAVGSFLNVVVYRLPLGLSIVHPPSHCPKCGKNIPWFDNIPILGWIFLRGRCRQCRAPISARYPLVEALTALTFATLAAVETDRLATAYPVEVLLLCTLLCAGLIEYDGHRPPWRLFVPAFLAGIAGRLFAPDCFAFPAWDTLPEWSRGTIMALPVVAVLPLLGIMFASSEFQLGAIPPAVFSAYVCMDYRAAGAALGLAAIGYFLLWPLGRFRPKLRAAPLLFLYFASWCGLLLRAGLASS